MKKILLILLLFSSISSNVFSQELIKNEIDEFTGIAIQETSWEKFIYDKSSSIVAYVRIKKNDDILFLNLKFRRARVNKVFSMDKGSELMIKMTDEDIIKLKNFEYQISCTGCGSLGLNGSGVQGINAYFPIDKIILNKLITGEALKIRIYTNDGYLENEIQSKYFKIFKNALSLID